MNLGTIPLDEMVDEYLQLEAVTGSRLSLDDLAADLADNACAHGHIEEEEADQFIHEVRPMLPGMTGRKK